MKTYEYRLVFCVDEMESGREKAERQLNELAREQFKVIKCEANGYVMVWTLEREVLPKTPHRG